MTPVTSIGRPRMLGEARRRALSRCEQAGADRAEAGDAQCQRLLHANR